MTVSPGSNFHFVYLFQQNNTFFVTFNCFSLASLQQYIFHLNFVHSNKKKPECRFTSLHICLLVYNVIHKHSIIVYI